ncbi:expansin EXLX1 family cellulose-binding protein [Actinocorallia populi]|uniref:expansin EXLX1 family cellulose-binding protein n=1 Tax=Actinocorallia populi TaxID=2079200 RepID=UPI000D089FD5|nr:expansin EXLX1 family cellulose-binding protein [Actinocorallia populi]
MTLRWRGRVMGACLVAIAAALLVWAAAVVMPDGTQVRPAAAKAAAAGKIKPGVTYRGVATFYDAGDGDGACMFGPASNLMIAAMNTTDYEKARACGAYVRVRANGRAITVKVTNECPTCGRGQLDLSRPAFAKLAAPVKGRIPITWRLLSPKASRKIAVRYKTGSTRWWCGIQAIDHRNPVARLEARTAKGWKKLPRTEYNYFLSAKGAGCGKAVRITDIYGQRLTIKGAKIRPDAVQRSRVQFAKH